MVFVGAIEAFDYSGGAGNKRNALSAFHPALPIYCTLRATYKGSAVLPGRMRSARTLSEWWQGQIGDEMQRTMRPRASGYRKSL